MRTIKTEMVRARISPDLKNRTEAIFDSLGLTPSQAVVLFYKQVELHNGLPFSVKMPVKPPLDISTMTREEFDAELQKGYDSMLAGRGRSIEDARKDFRRCHGKKISYRHTA